MKMKVKHIILICIVIIVLTFTAFMIGYVIGDSMGIDRQVKISNEYINELADTFIIFCTDEYLIDEGICKSIVYDSAVSMDS